MVEFFINKIVAGNNYLASTFALAASSEDFKYFNSRCAIDRNQNAYVESHGNYTTSFLSHYFYISCTAPMMKNAIYVTISAPRKSKRAVVFTPRKFLFLKGFIIFCNFSQQIMICNLHTFLSHLRYIKNLTSTVHCEKSN